MTIIGYARVSTEEQNLDLQMDALRAAGCERIFEDFGFSAIAQRRAGFDAALAALNPGDTFIIWKMDRAFRSLKQALDTLELLKTRNVSFLAITENIDTSTPMGQAMYQIRNVFAELERKLIGERTKAGMEAARRRGKVLGRRRLVSDSALAQAKEVLRADPDKTLKQVVRELGLKASPRTLGRALKRNE